MPTVETSQDEPTISIRGMARNHEAFMGPAIRKCRARAIGNSAKVYSG